MEKLSKKLLFKFIKEKHKEYQREINKWQTGSSFYYAFKEKQATLAEIQKFIDDETYE